MLGKVYEFDKTEENEIINQEAIDDDKSSTIKKYKKSDLINDGKNSFYKHHNIEIFDDIYFKLKYSHLIHLYYYLETI